MDTKMIRCSADEHYYDSERYSKCPYCNANMDEETVAISSNKKSVYSEDESTKAYWAGKKMEKSPVLGWLVVMEGKGVGQDFGIGKSLSTIGRDRSNDIVIDNGDEAISRDRHCLVEYDVKNNTFYIERGENNTYLNGERVGREGRELKGADVIEIGETKMQFVPFCTKDFSW